MRSSEEREGKRRRTDVPVADTLELDTTLELLVPVDLTRDGVAAHTVCIDRNLQWCADRLAQLATQ